MRKSPLIALFLTPWASITYADSPNVVTDIPPIHSLVAQVMQNIGEPDLLVDKNASPHAFSLRPSQAQALSNADLVFWIGPELTPWLDKSLQTLASNALNVPLLKAPNTNVLETRELEEFAKSDKHNEHEHEDHDDHDEHKHVEHEEQDEHGHEDHDEHGHDEHAHHHDGVDPHAWLDPENAKVWLSVIAAELGRVDPENANAYADNAQNAAKELSKQMVEVEQKLAAISNKEFIVFHDAFQYFEMRFGLPARGSIALSDATAPSPKRLTTIQNTIQKEGIACVFTEPQFNNALAETVTENSSASTAVLDPLGTAQTLGPDLYAGTLIDMAQAFEDCMTN